MFKLYRFLKPYTLTIIGVFVLVFIQSMSELYLPTLMSDIVDKGIVHGDTAYILKIGTYMLVVTGFVTVCSVLVSFFASRISMGLGKILRSRVFARVSSFSLQEFDQLGTATLITRTTNDITQMQMVTFMILRMMIRAPIMCIGGIIMAVTQDRQLALVFLAALPVVLTVFTLIAGKALPLFRLMQLKIDKLNLVVRENLTGIRVIRAFNRIDHEKQRFDAANRDLTDNAIRVNRLMATLMPVMMLILNLTIIAIIWFGSILIDNGNMQVGSLMAFIQYSFQIMMSLVMFSMMFFMLPRASASADRINQVLDILPTINDPEQPTRPENIRGFLEFKNVTFSFPGAEQPALRNISFKARPGETTAIIGGTGSGKSALVSLIPRFYDVDEGMVLVDGIDVRAMSQQALRSRIGFVPQKALLFTGTIAENIRFGRDDASDEEVHLAAETSQALDFIAAMPKGFDSVIAQGGTNLSGGQKQRLAIARALIRRPEIYIFDDSFSALDFKTDARLRAALRDKTSDATVLIVAQRVATVMDADRIIVLEEGQMVGMGTHKELFASCQVYREIVLSQLPEEELA